MIWNGHSVIGECIIFIMKLKSTIGQSGKLKLITANREATMLGSRQPTRLTRPYEYA
ncbi:hypothetical protein UFOVP247_5 [uncultured Caudovirales phage]|uniref:Uncharacterized protein n=1 Tax=uncultured Caudovirales phage TaxID=2100421 RepID=A0A6J7WUP8_9CAUD|nr:hypothetical protein UFOVP247_5 [uncultured Caudovirales phage]